MWTTLRTHWPAYLGEAAGLAFFMANAAWVATALEYPGSPLRRALGDGPVRRVVRRLPLGVAMGAVVVAIVYSPPGRRSGAHINPAVTAAFWRLGKISTADAAAYVAAQFVGATVAGLGVATMLGRPFRHPAVMMSTTAPGPAGTAAAFAAEFVMTFAVVAAVLFCLSHRRLAPWTGWVVAGLIMVFLWVETPLSGMSLNPARSFGSAVAARRWAGLWVYFAAPVLAALLAADLFARYGDMTAMRSSGLNANARLTTADQPVPRYPVDSPP